MANSTENNTLRVIDILSDVAKGGSLSEQAAAIHRMASEMEAADVDQIAAGALNLCMYLLFLRRDEVGPSPLATLQAARSYDWDA